MEIDGLVLRVNPYRDYDAMVTVINERSSFSFLARGVRKIQSKNSQITGFMQIFGVICQVFAPFLHVPVFSR